MAEATKKPATAAEPLPVGAIDLDAMLAKREEAVGSRDQFPFGFAGRVWWSMDPTLADDDWTAELRAISEDPDTVPGDVTAHYLGEEQWAEFKAAGGSSSLWSQALNAYLERQQSLDDAGNPTQGRRFSNRTQRRQKRR
ncbi:hypothetical protein ACH47B_06530 [Rhodococcus sp. NPDC019627]|uniref:hypothetical protein n=1 Tax=unclassified Rhodococcus (in: high G+C Gram-positive bacteria) TaxID=192944 RepID=UPI0037A2C3E7